VVPSPIIIDDRIWFLRKCRHAVRGTILHDLYSRRKQHDTIQNAEKGNQETGIGNTKNMATNLASDGKGRKHSSSGKRETITNDPGRNSDTGSSEVPNLAQKSAQKRHEMRLRHGHKSRVGADESGDPHASIPHAASGSTRHTGRGGFPGLQQILTYMLGRTSPQLYSRLSNSLRQYEKEGFHGSHPLQALGKTLEQPFIDNKDTKERSEAERVKWLPPGVRGMIVGRNSQFFEEELTDEDLELIAALEYQGIDHPPDISRPLQNASI
jgi:hypothetical protein